MNIENMEILILLCIISVVLNIAIYPLCKIKLRYEDAERIAEGKIMVKSEVMNFPKACWIVSAVMSFVAIFFHDDMGTMVLMIGMQCLVAFFLCLVTLFRRNSYYTIDDKQLTYVKHGHLEWSHSWDEIDHARKRIVSTGKSFIVLYDIVTKEGVKRRSLPAVLGRDLREHVRMDNRVKPVVIVILAILIFVIGTLIALGVFNS